MTEIQQQVYNLNEIWTESRGGTNAHIGKCNVLEKRPQVSCISRELSHIRQWRPVEILTTLPEHLSQSNGNSRIDRLIIESMKISSRSVGSTKVYISSPEIKIWLHLQS